MAVRADPDSSQTDIVDEKLIRDEYVCPYHGFLGEGQEPQPETDESPTDIDEGPTD